MAVQDTKSPVVPRNSFRIFTDRNGKKQLHHINEQGSVIPLEIDTTRLRDGYYTLDFDLIRLTSKPGK